MSLLVQVIVFIAAVLPNPGPIASRELNLAWYQLMRSSVSMSSIVKRIFEWRRAGINTTSRSANTDKYFLTTRKPKAFLGFLVSQTYSIETPYSRRASGISLTGWTSRWALSNSSGSVAAGAKNSLRCSRLAFRSLLEIMFTLRCAVPKEYALRWPFCGQSTERM